MPPAALTNSSTLQQVLNQHVHRVVFDDPRTKRNPDNKLGFPFGVVCSEVLQDGLSDFTEGHECKVHGTLTPRDKVLLYCFVLMKQHIFEARRSIEVHRNTVDEFLTGSSGSMLIDLGCGPGTAALAFAEQFPRKAIAYHAIDRASEMTRMASRLVRARSSLITPAKFYTTWSELTGCISGLSKPTNVIVFASFLFASKSLRVQDVVKLFKELLRAEAVESLMLIYNNSEHRVAGEKYEQFKSQLAGRYSLEASQSLTARFQMKPNGEAKSSSFKSELLLFKELP